jgi:hypothetical protein
MNDNIMVQDDSESSELLTTEPKACSELCRTKDGARHEMTVKKARGKEPIILTTGAKLNILLDVERADGPFEC